MATIKVSIKPVQAAPQGAPAAPPPALLPTPCATPAPIPAAQPGNLNPEQFKAECDRRRAAGLILAGNTWPIKQQIKAAGGIWDSRGKFWLLPNVDVLASMRAILPAGEPTVPASSRGSRKVWRRGHYVTK